MCGVVALALTEDHPQLGRFAAQLLQALEYRGYDSTGAAFQAADGSVRLLKAVGPPSRVIHEIGIVEAKGRLFCGQVRWATFGAVDALNAQPHEVRCRTHLYGAHNGNITNCDALKDWLASQGHTVVSDNDGEVVVHMIEHHFADALAELALPASTNTSAEFRLHPSTGVEAASASSAATGLGASAIVDASGPDVASVGRDQESGRRDSVPGGAVSPAARRGAMREAIRRATDQMVGSFAAVIVDPKTETCWAIKRGSSLYFAIHDGATGASSSEATVNPPPEDGRGGLEGPFRVASSDLSAALALSRNIVPLIDGEFVEFTALDHHIYRGATLEPIDRPAKESRLGAQDAALRPGYDTFMAQEIDDQVGSAHDLVALRRLAPALPWEATGVDAAGSQLGGHSIATEKMLIEAAELDTSFARFAEICAAAIRSGGRIDVIGCGSSYHAAQAGSAFFAKIAGVSVDARLPGDFRALRAPAVRDHDVVIAVSQSGETKDIIDILNDLDVRGRRTRRIALVNNVSSTLAEEKCELVIPIRCGPELAVPATKSFTLQLVSLFALAVKLAEARIGEDSDIAQALPHYHRQLLDIPRLLEAAVRCAPTEIARAALDLHLEPSIHILGTRLSAIAQEGALKIREVALNHTQGFEASEFKHGPNTILGGDPLLAASVRTTPRVEGAPEAEGLGPDRHEVGSAGYPLIYVTGPDERDIALTISQLNTHKIRGARTIVIAEEDPRLRAAATRAPMGMSAYRSFYIPLPSSGDPMMTAFTASVVLQRLALQMSLAKKRHLDALGVQAHGVHPDAPRNVSKSITVD